MEATMRERAHYVSVVGGNAEMLHPGCTGCEYDDVVVDGQTFSGMRPGLYRLVGFDPDSKHPYLAPDLTDPTLGHEDWEWI